MTFKKGESGNPGGRSTEKPFLAALRRQMARASTDAHNAYDQLAQKLMAAASRGESWAMIELINRLDGKPLQQTENHNINENHYVRAPEKANKDDWQKYLDHKAKPQTVSAKPSPGSNGSSNGAKH